MILSLLATFILTAAAIDSTSDSTKVTAIIPDSTADSVASLDSTAAVKTKEMKDSLAVYMLKGMVITATRTPLAERSAPASVSVIEPDPLTPNVDAANRLAQTAGVSLGSNGGLGSVQSLSIRGAPAINVLYLVDGIPVNSAQNGLYDLNKISSDIQRIEIVRGPASSLYGANAAAGVVNIITQDSKRLKPYSKINFEKGSFSSQVWEATSTRPLAQWADISIGASWKKNGGQRVNSDYDGTNYNIGISADPFEKWQAKVSYREYKSANGVPGSLSMSSAIARQKDYQKDLYFKTSYDRNSFVAITRNSIENIYYYDPSAAPTINYTLQTNVDAQYQQAWSPQLLTTLGAGYQLVDCDITNVGKPTLKQKALFLIQQYKPWENILFVGSARYDHNYFYPHQISPAISVSYAVQSFLSLFAGYSQAFRAPTINDLYYDDGYGFMYGNRNLQPEINYQIESGVKIESSILNLSFALFQRINREPINWGPIDPSNDYSPWTVTNTADAVSRGGEISIDKNIVPWLSLGGNYTYCKAVEKDSAEKPLVYQPRNVANFTVSVKDVKLVDDLWLGWKFQARYSDIQHTEKPNITLSDFIISDQTFSLKIADARVYYKVENLFNANYETRYGYPMPRRTQSFGVTLELWD
jgi:outer membrane cobalamin receptor